MTGFSGINAYKQANQVWNQRTEATKTNAKDTKTDTKNTKIDATDSPKAAESTNSSVESKVKVSTWNPISTSSALVPTNQDGIGMAIGNVQLSDKAKDYYSQLKGKFGNMQFIAVSSDMKDAVKAHAAAYGNSSKMVVLIDEAKLEQMANDESFRKKYEGIIAMAQSQMESARNSLTSSGASVKNFGMSVNSDGSTSFFATVEKASKDQAKRIEKKNAEKKAAKAKDKKKTEKKAQEKRLEKLHEDKEIEESDSGDIAENNDKKYVKFEANSIDDLISMVSKYAYDNSQQSVMTESEKAVGQNFDFKG